MTPDERNLLTRFLQDLTRVRGVSKDAEAAGLIDQTIRANPDAAYLLVQHAILSDQALYAAQGRIAELEGQLRQLSSGAAGPPSFLGAGAQGRAPWTQPGPNPGWQDPPRGGTAFGNIFGAGQPQPGGFGSFLRNAGTTAAGVAGGAFLFEGLSNLFGGHHGGGFFGGGYAPPTENVTINNYGDGDLGAGGGPDGFDDQVSYDSDNGDPLGDEYS
jgi:hypothetical protein